MVWCSINVYGVGSLHIWKDSIHAEEYMEVLEQHMLSSRQCLCQGRPCIFQQDNAKPDTATLHNSMASQESPGVELVWLRSRTFIYGKHLAHLKIKNPATKVQGCWAARILHQTRMGQHSSPETPTPHFPDVYRQLFWRGDTQWQISHCSKFVEMPSKSKWDNIYQ